MVNGINCGGCKKPLEAKLKDLEGVSECEIATKAESGGHPNKVTVKGAGLEVDKIKAAIAELDDGRGKFTVE